MTAYTPEQMTGAKLIATERARQIAGEGYSPEHDKNHAQELVQAAGRYVTDAEFLMRGGSVTAGSPELEDAHFGAQRMWPWNDESYKPGPDEMRTLVKAGALIAAAIDSLARGKADR